MILLPIVLCIFALKYFEMRHIYIVVLALFVSFGYSQKRLGTPPKGSAEGKAPEVKAPKATYTQYRIISMARDTTYVDTSLTIQKEYAYNYLRKDNFGLLPFSNEGQTYAVLDYGLKNYTAFPEIGFSGKQFNFMGVNDISYYSVATPVTELYYKTVMEQGHSIDALITLNTSERFNMAIAFKGLRSIGKYINQLSSTGNFRFSSTYQTKNKRYALRFHYTGQDFLNGENGGITTVSDFEDGNPDYQNRARLEVYLKDAKSFLKGKRFFADHSYRLNSGTGAHQLYLTHQFNYENKYYEYSQLTVPSTIGTQKINRFGDSYVTADIKDKTRYNKLYNKVGIQYDNALLGSFQFFAEDYRYNYYYDKVLFLDSGLVPSTLSDKIQTVGGHYSYRKNRWNGNFEYSNSVTKQALSTLEARMHYQLDAKNSFDFQYQMIQKLPDHVYSLFQSSYVDYNWVNAFKNEKIKNLEVAANTPWIKASLQLTALDDHLYFSNDATDVQQQIISPKQYGKTIAYMGVKASKEFRWWKLALDNTLLYQKVTQDDPILNVPQVLTRNTLYFSNYFFKRALYLQTGITAEYFSKHYINDYNPVTSEAFVQHDTEVGNFPLLDFFINARIRQTRIFLKAEHFNAKMGSATYYTAPNYPYRDFMIRFGLVWTFFQ
jgi:hypothetical protein